MSTVIRTLLLIAICLIVVPGVWAQTSGSHTVTTSIQPITVIAVSSDPLPLTLSSGSGAGLNQSVDASTHYNLTSNVDDVTIEATLDFPMPSGLKLRLRAESSLGRSLGAVTLKSSSRSKPIVDGIGRGLENGRTLEYELVANGNIGVIPLQERRITLTIVNPDSGFRQEVSQVVSFSVGDPLFEDRKTASN